MCFVILESIEKKLFVLFPVKKGEGLNFVEELNIYVGNSVGCNEFSDDTLKFVVE